MVGQWGYHLGEGGGPMNLEPGTYMLSVYYAVLCQEYTLFFGSPRPLPNLVFLLCEEPKPWLTTQWQNADSLYACQRTGIFLFYLVCDHHLASRYHNI